MSSRGAEPHDREPARQPTLAAYAPESVLPPAASAPDWRSRQGRWVDRSLSGRHHLPCCRGLFRPVAKSNPCTIPRSKRQRPSYRSRPHTPNLWTVPCEGDGSVGLPEYFCVIIGLRVHPAETMLSLIGSGVAGQRIGIVRVDLERLFEQGSNGHVVVLRRLLRKPPIRFVAAHDEIDDVRVFGVGSCFRFRPDEFAVQRIGQSRDHLILQREQVGNVLLEAVAPEMRAGFGGGSHSTLSATFPVFVWSLSNDDLGGRMNLIGLCQGGCMSRCLPRVSRTRSRASCSQTRRST